MLRYQRQRPRLIVIEKRHPLFGSVVMAMDEMRCIQKFNALCLERLMGDAHIIDVKIEYRVSGRALAFRQEQPEAAAIEECEIAEGIKIREPQRIFIPFLRLFDALNAARDLSDPADHIAFSYVHGFFMKNAVAANAIPIAQFRAPRKAELCKHIRHVEFDRVDADAVTHGLHRAPFGGR